MKTHDHPSGLPASGSRKSGPKTGSFFRRDMEAHTFHNSVDGINKTFFSIKV